MRLREEIVFGGAVVLMLLAHKSGITAEASVADAAEKGDFSSVRLLLAQKADASAAQEDGMTALHWAVQHDDAEAVKALLTAGADVKATNRYRVTPLSLACLRGNQAVLEALLAAGADPNTSLPGGETALMTACRTGRVGPVKMLLAKGADADAREQKGQTALMWAAADGNVEVVDVLLSAGADFRTPLSSGFTPFFFAIREGRSEVVFRLLSAGMDVNEPMRPAQGKAARGKTTSPLSLAIENGHFQLAVALLNAGANPNAQPSGYAPLHAINWVRRPLGGDTDPPPQGSGNLDSLEMVRQLVAHGADISIRLEKGAAGKAAFNMNGATPYLLAARNSDLPLLKLLLKLGADPKLANVDGLTPLLAAAGVGALNSGDELPGTEEEAIEAVQMQLDLGADINTVDKNKETAIHGAVYQERSLVVQYLVDRGAKIDVWHQKNKWGWTPHMVALGNRPGNFRPSPQTIVAIEKLMRAGGIDPAKTVVEQNRPQY